MNNDSGRNQNEKMSVIAPGFHPISPDVRLTTQPNSTNVNDVKIFQKPEITLTNVENTVKTNILKPTILST